MAATYFIQRGAKSHGPFSLDQVRGGVRSRKLAADDRCSDSNSGPWSPLSSLLPELFNEDPLGFDGLITDAVAKPEVAQVSASIYCRTCGRPNPVGTIACDGCGVPPRRGRSFCGKCGHAIANPEAIMCVKCRTMFDDPAPVLPAVASAALIGVARETDGRQATKAEIERAVQSLNGSEQSKTYYQRIFTDISDNGGRSKPSWNWSSFLFGFFYYLHHGLYIKALIGIAACFLLAGLPAPLIWLYCGLFFNYDLYLKKVKNIDLW